MAEVYCNDLNCLHCVRLDKKHIIEFNKNYVPLGDDEGFVGKCTRSEIGIEPKVIITDIAKYKTMNCVTRSDKGLSGHKDFTKMGPQLVDEDGIKEYNRDKGRHYTKGFTEKYGSIK